VRWLGAGAGRWLGGRGRWALAGRAQALGAGLGVGTED